MNNFVQLTTKSLTELAEWLDKHGNFDGSPWMTWFNERYCNICPSIILEKDESIKTLGIEPFFGGTVTCGYCEVHNKCRYFPDMEKTPTNTDIIKLWLKEKANEE